MKRRASPPLLWRLAFWVVVLLFIYQAWLLLHVWWWVDHNPDSSAFMSEQEKVLQNHDPGAEIQYRWVPYNRISNQLKRAVIVAEDAKFVDHEGFDWDGMQKAYEKNVRKGKIVAGGSTISQQLAKNLFLSGRRTPWRKLEEALITVMLENMMSKRRILEIYLNIIEWGNGVFGAEAASRHYYRISAAALGAEQAAQMAAMVPNPRFYDHHRGARGLARKTEIILARMSQAEVP
jgi:monofunctional glycosyltransferase